MPPPERGAARPRPAAKPTEQLIVEQESNGIVSGRRGSTHGSILDTLEDPRLEVEAECDLHGHTVILETGKDYLGEPPAVWGRAGSRTYHARPDHTGLRHTFLLRDPLESVFITSSITDSSSPAVDREVSGPETRIPWR